MADKYEEENWNLEVALQELHSQRSDAQAATQHLETEHKRLTKALAQACDNADHHKIESERLQGAFEELKNKHETDIAQARKHAAGLVCDKLDLQQTINTTTPWKQKTLVLEDDFPDLVLRSRQVLLRLTM